MIELLVPLNLALLSLILLGVAVVVALWSTDKVIEATNAARLVRKWRRYYVQNHPRPTPTPAAIDGATTNPRSEWRD